MSKHDRDLEQFIKDEDITPCGQEQLMEIMRNRRVLARVRTAFSSPGMRMAGVALSSIVIGRLAHHYGPTLVSKTKGLIRNGTDKVLSAAQHRSREDDVVDAEIEEPVKK